MDRRSWTGSAARTSRPSTWMRPLLGSISRLIILSVVVLPQPDPPTSAGSVLGTIATQIQTAALDWELYQRTGSVRFLGWVGLVQFLPVLLLALPAGQAADHYSRKGLVVAAQGLIGLAALGLTTLSLLQ